MTEYFNEQLQVFQQSLASMDNELFEHMVRDASAALQNNCCIVATGLGKNVPICEKFVGTMVSLGLRTQFMNTNSAVHGDLGCLHDGDMLIVLSKSGETEESLRLVREIRKQERKITIWLITYTRGSSLEALCDHSLVMNLAHEGDAWNIVPTNSSTINLIVLQGLAILTAQRMGITLEDFAKNHPGGAIGDALQKRSSGNV